MSGIEADAARKRGDGRMQYIKVPVPNTCHTQIQVYDQEGNFVKTLWRE